MHILAIEKETSAPPVPNIKELLRAETASVWDLRERGIIREIWFTVDGHNAVIMLDCRSESEARRHLGSLPLVRAGVIDFEVHGLHAYDGFERLFSAGGSALTSSEAGGPTITATGVN